MKGDKHMGCTKAQIVALIAYVLRVCREAESLEKCLSKIEIIKERAEELALKEFIDEFF